MTIEYASQITEEAIVYNILKEVDHEFLPPLSQRDRTTYKVTSVFGDNTEPTRYFSEIKEQQFLFAKNERLEIIGFMSFKHNASLPELQFDGIYVTTICILQGYRGLGLTQKMYNKLRALYNKYPITTRTWSTNYSHLHILDKLGFRLVACIKDDRAIGIDTVYYST